MIRVRPRPEPQDFDARVRQPGLRWLAENPADHELKPLWREMGGELARAYRRICAYFGTYVQPVTGANSADHFVPKSLDRDRSYDWDNYRFACQRMNARKGDAQDVLDPFEIEDGWFILNFSTLDVLVAPGLSLDRKHSVRATIDRLGLNSEECVQERDHYWGSYLARQVSASFLYRHAPFLAIEALRQGLLHPEDRALPREEIRAWLDADASVLTSSR